MLVSLNGDVPHTMAMSSEEEYRKAVIKIAGLMPEFYRDMIKNRG